MLTIFLVSIGSKPERDSLSNDQLNAFRNGAARALQAVGIDLQGQLHRLSLANRTNGSTENQKQNAYFFLLLNDKDLNEINPKTVRQLHQSTCAKKNACAVFLVGIAISDTTFTALFFPMNSPILFLRRIRR